MNSEKLSTESWPFEFSPSGLVFDAKNLFVVAYAELQIVGPLEDLENLEPLRTYEEYLRQHYRSSPEEAEEGIKKSNPDSVRKVNELVVEYNSALPRIKSEKNARLGLEILGRINKVFNEQ